MLTIKGINELVVKQKKLDSFVLVNNKVVGIKEKMVYALKIELYEFINSLATHKHWKKTPFNKDNAKEELIDIVHFTLSCLIESKQEIKVSNYNFDTYEVTFVSIQKLERDFLEIYYCKDYLKLLFFLEHVYSLFFGNDFKQQYERKYEINIKRQKENY